MAEGSGLDKLDDPYTSPTSEALATGWGLAHPGTVEPSGERADGLTTEPAQQEQEAKVYRARKAREMSWDDYLGLGDKARAAVDFNTLLIQAREKDLKSDYEYNDMQREVYDNAVERMFGEEGGSETFAPETLALLNDIKFEQTDAKRFDDLDDFLGLSAALTAKDIERLGSLNTAPLVPAGEMELSVPSMLNGSFEGGGTNATAQEVSTALAAGTQDLQEALTRGNQVLENWRMVAASTRNETLSFYGGTPNKLASPDIRLGANDEYFQMAFNTLADAANGPEVVELIRKDLGDKAFLRFMAFADTKSKYSQDLGVGLGGDPSVQYRTPDDFRKVLGLNESGDPDATP